MKFDGSIVDDNSLHISMKILLNSCTISKIEKKNEKTKKIKKNGEKRSKK